MATVNVTITETAVATDAVHVTVASEPVNTLAPNVRGLPRDRHYQQRLARAEQGYAGQETIKTLGTIATGTWQGDPIARPYLQVLDTVTCCWTGGAFPAYVYNNGDAGAGATITFNAAGTVTVDGHLLVAGDTVLLTGSPQADGSAGVYLVTTSPSATVAGVLTRHPAFDQDAEFPGAIVTVQLGTANRALSFRCLNSTPLNAVTTNLWTQVFASLATGTTLGTITVGTGLSITNAGLIVLGSTVDISLSFFTTLGDIIYGGAAGAVTRLAGNTTATKKFLRQTGTGAVSAAPAWDTVTAADVGLGNVENTALSTWAGSTNLTTLGTLASAVVFLPNGGSASARGTGTLDKTTASAAFNTLSTVADTTIYTATVKGNSLGANGGIRVTIGGDVLCNSGAPTWRITIQFGGTTLWADVSNAFGASATRFPWYASFLIGNAGATNAQVLSGVAVLGRAVAAITGEGSLNTAPTSWAPVYGTATVDTTADQNIVVAVRPSVSNVAVEITRKWAVTEILP